MKLDNNGKTIDLRDYEGKIINLAYDYSTTKEYELDQSIEFDDVHMKKFLRSIRARYTECFDVPIEDALLEPAPDTIDNMEREQSIKSAVFDTLSERDGNILLEHFGVGVLGDKGLTTRELAAKYKMSHDGIAKIIQRAVANPGLKTHLQSAFIN
jgi:DNA-directed RNA polymerase sigma subunit (sigma70/sigma32)